MRRPEPARPRDLRAPATPAEDALHALEFVRSAWGLLPAAGDRDPGVATFMPPPPGEPVRPWRSCTCKRSKTKRCGHLKLLDELLADRSSGDAAARFAESFWQRLAEILIDGEPVDCRSVLHSTTASHEVFLSPAGDELTRWSCDAPGATRLRDRLIASSRDEAGRARLLEKLGRIASTDSERTLNKHGHRSQRQLREASFWGRLAYHCFRELGGSPEDLRPAIDLGSGAFTLTCHDANAAPLARLAVPRAQVRRVLDLLASEDAGYASMAISPVPLRSIFSVARTTELDLEVRPVIEALQASGERRFFERTDLAKFIYGDLVYVPELAILAELERPGRERRFRAPVAMKLARSQVPQFLDRHREEIESGAVVLARSLEPLAPFERPDRVAIAVGRSAGSGTAPFRVTVEYGFGEGSAPLAEVARARANGQPFLDTAGGWVDVQAPFFARLGPLGGIEDESGAPELRLGAAEILRLTCGIAGPVEVQGRNEAARRLRRLVTREPSEPAGELEGLTTPLRSYQKLGLDWLRFLHEHGLGGLLCDEMGLGKTHQAMALMLWLRERREIDSPFLVVCPTTVVSHWREKLRVHAPRLRVVVHHGATRGAVEPVGTDVLLTTYGILRNDVERIAATPYALAVFDEIQYLKNKETGIHQAARRIDAAMRLGLTGTPVENSLHDLKSLLDLVLPGYLGGDAAFERDYVATDGATPAREAARSARRLEELQRVISPFVLRRLKAAVLDELPEKIEDVRTCRLSEEQLALYRDALASRGRPLLERLRSAPATGEPLPYLHVFALLSYLKQVCDHPGLARREDPGLDDDVPQRSGKWELFQELLFESLDGGQKVVVFTQFLGMVERMARLLERLGVGYSKLTGASRERGSIVRRFNEDAACRVFLGSLKAGGTGIDLVGGSVVIHYDRWWNAAREDQATDRVHRIGQKRGVQVFKLVTEGTLEERIAAIIDRKRDLMNRVVRPDDPRLSKVFTREELIELLQPI